MRTRQRKIAALVAVALLAAGLGVLAYATHALRGTELQSIDARFSVRGTERPPSNVVLVLIDDNTFAELTRLGLPSEFPFKRTLDAKVIDNLRGAGARTVAMDIEFAHATDEVDDIALFEALRRLHGHTVLAATQVGAGGATEVIGGAEAQKEAGVRVGEAVLTPDSDGTIRRLNYSYHGLRSLPVVAAEDSTGHPVPRSRFEAGGTLPIDYAGPTGTFPSISFGRVLQGRFPAGFFAGRTVIVGASAPVLQDVHTTATSGSRPMSGPEIVANETATLLRGAPLRMAPGWVDVLLVIALGVAAPLGGLRVRRWRALLDALALAVVFIVLVQVIFQDGVIVSFVYPLLALMLGTLGTLGVLYVQETIERERVRSVFARFVPGDVVAEVLASAGENLRLGGVERDCTVMFSDLRGFTSFSSDKPAAFVIEVVNHYLNEMSEAILDAGGTLVAYMGDGIMAVFGAPLPQEDHAERALRAAREMIGPRLQRFNDWIAEEGFAERFAMGVGLHSGPVMSGNVGSEQRVEYTAIGDTTNTASRLEGMTKGSGEMLFLSSATRERLGEALREDLRLVGDLQVRGREGTLRVWTVRRDGEPRDGASGEAQRPLGEDAGPDDGRAREATSPGAGEPAGAVSEAQRA